MHGRHVRSARTPGPGMSPAGPSYPRHARRGPSTSRLRRRITAYREVDLLTATMPAGSVRPAEECLLLVHSRHVVGHVCYRICRLCARGTISALAIDEPFLGTGLDTRALAHLKSRHPDLHWFSTLHQRTTRDLLRRMGVPVLPDNRPPCAHSPADPAPTRTAGPRAPRPARDAARLTG
ncbi:hypothetical protein [Streptomyces zhihengii]